MRLRSGKLPFLAAKMNFFTIRVGYTMDKIISGERENPILPRLLAGDRLLLVVHGEVIAGMDLSKLQPSDVVVSGRSVSIHLPQAEIFTTRLDNAKTRVYSRDTGLFSTADPNLEGEVRQEAERQLQAAALQDGILKIADKNARQTLTSMLTGLVARGAVRRIGDAPTHRSASPEPVDPGSRHPDRAVPMRLSLLLN